MATKNNPNPNDATFINIEALKVRVDTLERQMKALLKGSTKAAEVKPIRRVRPRW